MIANTGAPKATPAQPVKHLKTLSDTELWEVVQDKDYSEHYRSLAKDERILRSLMRS